MNEHKNITSAIVIINSNNEILGCHGFGKPKDYGYDFPKGLVNQGESDIDAAKRECLEETDYQVKGDLIDYGVHPHNKEKEIHLFVLHTDDVDITKLKCNSYFERDGKQYPEVDGYKWIGKDERHLFNKVLQKQFNVIDE